MKTMKQQMARALFMCLLFGVFLLMGEFRAWLASHGMDDETQMWVAGSMMILTLVFLGLYYLYLSHLEKTQGNIGD